MTRAGIGALVGLTLGLSVLLVGSWLRARRALPLVDRIGPFVGRRPRVGRRSVPPSAIWTVLRGAAADDTRSGDRDLALRLLRSGQSSTPVQYRLERLAWCALGAGCGVAAGAGVSAGGSPGATALVVGVVGGVGAWSARDAALSRRIRSRQQAIERALPTLADLMALAVASGASPIVALERAAQTMTGPLADEVARVGVDIRVGTPFDAALRGMADRVGVVAVQRFLDGIVVAMERGTPLVEVVRAQAADARAEQARHLMESAGRKDVAMLVPIVFLVLPSVVLIALYPGLQALRLVVP